MSWPLVFCKKNEERGRKAGKEREREVDEDKWRRGKRRGKAGKSWLKTIKSLRLNGGPTIAGESKFFSDLHLNLH